MSDRATPPAWAYLSLAASMALVGSYVGLSKLLLAVDVYKRQVVMVLLIIVPLAIFNKYQAEAQEARK